MRFFNTAGPVNAAKHYCLPPLERFDLDMLLRLIGQEKYFVLHAPRQTGKTTCLLALMGHLNQAGRYRCVYLNVEKGQSAREDVTAAMQAILDTLATWAERALGDRFVEDNWDRILAKSGGHSAFSKMLTLWAEQDSRPLVLLIDEVDSLLGDTLVSLLRQLREGYPLRPSHFPQSIVLCGVRDVRDYRIRTSSKEVITGGSAFNIKAESLRLGDFSRQDVGALFQQHFDETGQEFSPLALERIWELTQGQPWLVNAMGYECCFRFKGGFDRSRRVTRETVDQSRENLIVRRETHLDQLADKLQEERVRRVIEVLLAGNKEPQGLLRDNVDYVRDLGLIRRNPPLAIANPIYREVIPRELVSTTEETIAQDPQWYVRPEGSLDLEKLLAAFTDFFRQHSEHWIERFDYKEAGPQLLLQAFLQRIVNSGGRIEREYGLGRRRTDLLVSWPHQGGKQLEVIELKIQHGSRQATIAEGLPQTADYMDRCGALQGHLVIFDRTEGKSWEERIFRDERIESGKTIQVWGM